MRAAALPSRSPGRHLTPLALILLLAAVVVLGQLAGSGWVARTVTEMLVDVVLVVGLYSFIGNSGIISFGQIGFMAIGAYAWVWQTLPLAMKSLFLPGLPAFLLTTDVPLVPAALLAALVAAAVALVAGLVIMRMAGTAASIATFAFLVIVQAVYSNWDTVTGGASALAGVPVYLGPWSALAWAAFAILLAHLHAVSRFGLALRAVRDDEPAAVASGIAVLPSRLVAYVLSGFLVGLAGTLHAGFLGVVSPDVFYLGRTFTSLAMLVCGGMQSLSGAVFGVLVLSAASAGLTQLESGVGVGGLLLQLPSGMQQVLIGVAMILILIHRPGGLLRNREWAVIPTAWRRPQAPRPATVDAPPWRVRPETSPAMNAEKGDA